jgi:hypothetical protein
MQSAGSNSSRTATSYKQRVEDLANRLKKIERKLSALMF